MAGIQELSDADLMAMARPAATAAPAAPDISQIPDDQLLAMSKGGGEQPGFFGALAKRVNDAARSVAKPGSPVAENGLAAFSPGNLAGDVKNWWKDQQEIGRQADEETGGGRNPADMETRLRLRHAQMQDFDPFAPKNATQADAARLAFGFAGMTSPLGAKGAPPIAAMVERPGAVPTPAPKPTPMQQILDDFERNQVDPTLPAVVQSPSVSRLANVIRQTPGVGIPVQRGAERVIDQTAAAAERVAQGYGEGAVPIQAGRTLQRGAEKFVGEGDVPGTAGLAAEEVVRLPTRASSFGEKSATLYDQFGKLLDQTKPIALEGTTEALGGITKRFPTNPEFGKSLVNPKFAGWLEKLDNGTLTWPELKEFRSFVGSNLEGRGPVSDIPMRDWERLYAGISRDMEGAAAEAGPRASQLFNRANDYYGAGLKRIKGPINDILKPENPEAAYADVIAAAGEKGKSANVGKLYALRRSMSPDEWNDVAATTIRNLGRPVASARNEVANVEGHADFSPSSYVTNFEKLSPEARDVLFNATGNAELRSALDSLTRAVGAEKNVEKLRNFSNTGQAVTTTALINGAIWAPLHTAAAAGGAATAGYAMMNPGFVRWLAGTIQQQGNSAAWAPRLAALAGLAKKDPSLAPVYRAYSQQPPGAAAEEPQRPQ